MGTGRGTEGVCVLAAITVGWDTSEGHRHCGTASCGASPCMQRCSAMHGRLEVVRLQGGAVVRLRGVALHRPLARHARPPAARAAPTCSRHAAMCIKSAGEEEWVGRGILTRKQVIAAAGCGWLALVRKALQAGCPPCLCTAASSHHTCLVGWPEPLMGASARHPQHRRNAGQVAAPSQPAERTGACAAAASGPPAACCCC